MTLTIYHNPRCSKSRATLQLLQDRGLSPKVVEYLKTPPTQAELTAIAKALAVPARDLLRKGEAPYKELGLDDPGLGDAKAVAAMAAHPILLERPIVVKNGKAAIGRPPEAVLDIL